MKRVLLFVSGQESQQRRECIMHHRVAHASAMTQARAPPAQARARERFVLAPAMSKG